MALLSIILQVNITEKVKHAPDPSYQIGIVMGNFLPFLILVGIAYWMYYRAKNRNDNE